ncbi:hypothetical protein Ppa06_37590 [Planomonospora parontospora subsp. parontospora]|uniref:Uncharacterized protein n=2 Tax=Planomonospora parontospora TaxID=58119 RepID=A0AA37F5Y2_9ACTN|nr:hypothetical protein GCM10010126_41310 [Planomonospora parontospora]GII09961.1 hypothetical protein Ppa06_37590 [Planomonospora parontospora subsp. parontospora]
MEREATRGTPGARRALMGVHRMWAHALDEPAHVPARTRAWPMPGGLTTWLRLVDTADSGWRRGLELL